MERKIQRNRFALTRTLLPAILAVGWLAVPAVTLAGDEKPDPFKLRQEIKQAYRAKNYKKALESAEKLYALEPADIATHYNIACLHCLLGDKAKAYEWIEKTIAAGYRDADGLAADADFRTICGEDRFREIVGELRARTIEPGSAKGGGNAAGETPDDGLSPQERVEKIHELTQALVASSDESEREKALGLALEAGEHAKKLRTQVGPRANGQLALTYYNIACMQSLLKHTDPAVDALRTAVEIGVWPGQQDMLAQIERDSDLDHIRKDERVVRIVDWLKDLRKSSELSNEKRMERIQELTGELIAAARANNHEKALQIALTCARLADNSLTNYNVACMYSLRDKRDQAFDYLERAMDRNDFFNDPVALMEGDSDLDNLRKDARYKTLLARATQLRDNAGGGAAQQQTQGDDRPQAKTAEFQWKVTLPKHYDGKKAVPLIVALHHYHGNMERTTERWAEAANEVGAILLTPQGTQELGEGMYEWGGDVDAVDRNVMKAINAVMDEHKVDDGKIVLAGFSQGGWLTWALAQRHPDAFCGIIPVCGHFRETPGANANDPDLAKLRVVVLLGGDENQQVIDSNRHAAEMLEKKGAKVRVNIYDGVAHGYPQNSTEELIKALKFVM